MLVSGRWTADWQPAQAKDEKGGFVRQTSLLRHRVTPDGAGRLQGGAGALPSLCRADLPLGLAYADRAQAERPRRDHLGVGGRAGTVGSGLALPGVAETVDLDRIKRGDYSIKSLNPSGSTPLGPALAWSAM